MSIVIRPSKNQTPAPIHMAEDKTARPSYVSFYRPRYQEAPDAGYTSSEASESGFQRNEEPEARTNVSETPIYHGRSRS